MYKTKILNESVDELQAYHGSAANFDKFNHKKYLSSGAGSQVFGWGTYVTDDKVIGKSYAEVGSKKQGGRPLINGAPVRSASQLFKYVYQFLPENHKDLQGTIAQLFYRYLCDSYFSLSMVKSYVQQGIEKLNEEIKNSLGTSNYNLADVEQKFPTTVLRIYGFNAMLNLCDYFKESGVWKENNNAASYVYEVDIPDDNGSNYLDWYELVPKQLAYRIFNGLANLKPQWMQFACKNNVDFKYNFARDLSEHGKEKTVNYYTNEDGYRSFLDKYSSKYKGGTGSDFYWMLKSILGSPKAASLFLMNLCGFDGIKYESGTRWSKPDGAAEDGHNYVIFDANKVKITNKANNNPEANQNMQVNEGATKRATVNMSVELRKGGRNAVKMSVEELRSEIEHAHKLYLMNNGMDTTRPSNRRLSIDNFVYQCCRGSKNLLKDNLLKHIQNDVWQGKYNFDSENCDSIGDIKMSKKGVPYIEIRVGGDWESPVCFFIYYDGNKLRGYVPLKGNAINRDINSAFGNNDEADEKFIRKEYGLSNNEEFPFNNHDVNYNKDACLDDFMSRIEIKGTYKKKDYSLDDSKFEEYKKTKKREKEEREKNKMTEYMQVNESELRNVIKETITNILMEAIPSKQLSDYFAQHGGVKRLYTQDEIGDAPDKRVFNDGLGDINDDAITYFNPQKSEKEAHSLAWELNHPRSNRGGRHPYDNNTHYTVYKAQDGTAVVVGIDKSKVEMGHTWGGEMTKKTANRVWNNGWNFKSRSNRYVDDSDTAYYGKDAQYFGIKNNHDYKEKLEHLKQQKDSYEQQPYKDAKWDAKFDKNPKSADREVEKNKEALMQQGRDNYAAWRKKNADSIKQYRKNK